MCVYRSNPPPKRIRTVGQRSKEIIAQKKYPFPFVHVFGPWDQRGVAHRQTTTPKKNLIIKFENCHPPLPLNQHPKPTLIQKDRMWFTAEVFCQSIIMGQWWEWFCWGGGDTIWQCSVICLAHTVSGSSKLFALMSVRNFKHSSSRSWTKWLECQDICGELTFNQFPNYIVILHCCEPEIWDACRICKTKLGEKNIPWWNTLPAFDDTYYNEQVLGVPSHVLLTWYLAGGGTSGCFAAEIRFHNRTKLLSETLNQSLVGLEKNTHLRRSNQTIKSFQTKN